MHADQAEFDIRCEWGERGAAVLAPISDVVVIVDVLSFSTCVDIATSRGASVYPYRWNDDSAAAYAALKGAMLAAKRGAKGRYSLSPRSLEQIPAGAALVLPSPNGATLSFATGRTPTLCGCLRNAAAVAAHASRFGKRVAVVPAGERWDDGSLRPAVEDFVGAGAIIRLLAGRRSAEAHAAVAAFENAASDLAQTLCGCTSGKELIDRDFASDVTVAARLDCSSTAPLLSDGCYQSARTDKDR